MAFQRLGHRCDMTVWKENNWTVYFQPKHAATAETHTDAHTAGNGAICLPKPYRNIYSFLIPQKLTARTGE